MHDCLVVLFGQVIELSSYKEGKINSFSCHLMLVNNMVMKALLVVVLLVSSLRLSACQAPGLCGTADSCSTEYSQGCPEDVSTALTCMESQTSCNEPILAPADT